MCSALLCLSELVPAEPRISSRRSTLDKPSRTHTKKKQHSGKHKKTRGHSVNTDDREGLADAETASISSQPGASATSDVTAEVSVEFSYGLYSPRQSLQMVLFMLLNSEFSKNMLLRFGAARFSRVLRGRSL